MANTEEEIIRDDAADVLLRTMEEGRFMDAFGAEVRRTVLDLRQKSERDGRSMGGSITVKINLKMDPQGVLESEADMTTKLPKVKRMRSIHWTDEDGDITNRRAERQLELKIAPKTKAAAPEAAPTAEPKAPAQKGM